jgi:hypothetical protein
MAGNIKISTVDGAAECTRMGVTNNEALTQEVPRQRGGGVLQARAPGKHDIRAEGSVGVGTPHGEVWGDSHVGEARLHGLPCRP